ncbi:gamma-glutamylcyclotransferase [Tropicimonas aquimaris]|uniref:glutathione-specific gamma-glutamylcyclotransferase n=1 Tax=Tropicimonas aquimaris TaxID=914152 RepID=A0ABW3IP30_9RHOB
MSENDPFHLHPGLRGLIKDPEDSFFRTFQPSDLDELIETTPGMVEFRMPDEEREACRKQLFENWTDGDLWVFGYGSLMWDPAFRFREVRRAHVPDHERVFCLVEVGGRGTPDAPGLMAGLAPGDGCDGLVFRIAEADIPVETEILWRRERIGPAYAPEFLMAETVAGPVRALAFVADESADIIDLTLSREAQVRHIATGKGILGTSLEYLENIVRHFEALGIEDPDLVDLLRDARALAADLAQ